MLRQTLDVSTIEDMDVLANFPVDWSDYAEPRRRKDWSLRRNGGIATTIAALTCAGLLVGVVQQLHPSLFGL